jgi:hypothetical protein
VLGAFEEHPRYESGEVPPIERLAIDTALQVNLHCDEREGVVLDDQDTGAVAEGALDRRWCREGWLGGKRGWLLRAEGLIRRG